MSDADEPEAVAALRERVEHLEAIVTHLSARMGPPSRLGRLLRALVHPRLLAHRARAFVRRATITSRRSVWTGDRWRSRLEVGVFARSLIGKLGERALGRRQPAYDAAPFAPTAAGTRPRVLHVIANTAVGGSTQLVVDLMNRLGHRYQMEVLTSAVPPGPPHRNMAVRLVPQPATRAAVAAAFEAARPDLVHVHYWGDVDARWYQRVFAGAEAWGAPVIENINTPVAPHRSPAVRAYVYVSDTVRRTFGAGGDDERVIHPGSDLPAFAAPASVDPHAAHSIGMVYRLERDKLNAQSILPLIEVVRRRPQTRAFVIGQGSLFDGFVAQVAAAGLRDNFVFAGAVPYAELPAWYARFAVFVAPVWQESFGQVTPFAMSQGQAVVGARVGALPEILGAETWLADTPGGIAELAVRLLDDPGLRERVGAENRARAAALFGMEAMIAGYAALYEALAPVPDLMPGFPPAEAFAS